MRFLITFIMTLIDAVLCSWILEAALGMLSLFFLIGCFGQRSLGYYSWPSVVSSFFASLQLRLFKILPFLTFTARVSTSQRHPGHKTSARDTMSHNVPRCPNKVVLSHKGVLCKVRKFQWKSLQGDS